MNFFLCGYYGAKNLGDELLLLKICKDISAIDNNPRFFVWTTDKGYTKEFLGEFDTSCVPVDRFSLDDTVDAVKSCDVVIYGGGGLIQEHYGIKIKDIFSRLGGHIATYVIPALFGRIYQRRIFMWGLGHGPVFTEEGKLFSKWFYSLSDVVVLRDLYSFEALRELGINNTVLDIDPLFDLDFNIISSKSNIKPDTKSILGISLRKGFFEDRISDELLDALLEIHRERPDISFFPIPCDLNLDVDVIENLKNSLKEKQLPIVDIEIKSLSDVVKAISSCSWFLGMRLHSVIAAYKLKVKTAVISYDIKTDELAELLNLPHVRFLDANRSVLYKLLNQLIYNKPTFKGVDFQYKAPELFGKFLKDGALKIAQENLKDNISFCEKDREHAKNFIGFLLAQKSKLTEEIVEKNGRINYLSNEYNYLKNEYIKLEKRDNDCRSTIEEQRKAISELKDKIGSYKQEIANLKLELKTIYNSNWWKLGQKYYRFRDSGIIRRLYPLYKPVVDKLFGKNRADLRADVQTTENINNNKDEQLREFLFENKKLVIIISGIPFDELLNQRPLNIAKELARSYNFGVLFAVWQLESRENYRNFYSRILEVPLEELFSAFESLEFEKSSEKILYITFPLAHASEGIRKFRERGFKIVYDIMDDWEGFLEVNQASWYDKEIEEKIILETDFVIAVNEYLKEKFSHLREDINVVGNGFDEDTIGSDSKFIAGTVETERPTIGYFGWLNKSRFDWDFVFELSKRLNDFDFEIIGYGMENEILEKIKESINIRFAGKVQPSELKGYVCKWNLGIIPFVDSSISKGSDPLKIYQYIYFGLPTLVKSCEGVSGYPLVFFVDSLGDASKVAERFKDKKKVLDYVERNSGDIEGFLKETLWEKRVESILDIIDRKVIYQ